MGRCASAENRAQDLLKKIDDCDASSGQPEKSSLGRHTATERGKTVELAKGGAFQLQTSLFQRFHNTPVFIGQLLPFSFTPSHCPYWKELYRHENSNQFPLFSQ